MRSICLPFKQSILFNCHSLRRLLKCVPDEGILIFVCNIHLIDERVASHKFSLFGIRDDLGRIVNINPKPRFNGGQLWNHLICYHPFFICVDDINGLTYFHFQQKGQLVRTQLHIVRDPFNGFCLVVEIHSTRGRGNPTEAKKFSVIFFRNGVGEGLINRENISW